MESSKSSGRPRIMWFVEALHYMFLAGVIAAFFSTLIFFVSGALMEFGFSLVLLIVFALITGNLTKVYDAIEYNVALNRSFEANTKGEPLDGWSKRVLYVREQNIKERREECTE